MYHYIRIENFKKRGIYLPRFVFCENLYRKSLRWNGDNAQKRIRENTYF